MAEFSAAPIEPGPGRSPEVEELLSTWANLRLPAKILIGSYAFLGGMGSLYASQVLVREVHHWGAWAFAILVLDPIAAAGLLCVAMLIAPHSFLASLLASAIRRAKIVAVAFIIASASVIAGLIAFAAWQVWSAR